MTDHDRFTTAELHAMHADACTRASRCFESAKAITVASSRIPWDDDDTFRRVMRTYRDAMAAGDEQMREAYEIGAELLRRDARDRSHA